MRIKNIALIATVLLVPSLVLASGAEHHDVTMFNSDFFYRVLNFSVFIGILYYLIANPIKEYFVGRSEGIANQLEEIEEKLQASKNARLTAEENVVKAESKAKEIISNAGDEAKILSANIADKNAIALAILEKQADEKQALSAKKATQATIDALLNDGFNNSDINIDEAKVVSLISDKVA
ncbi:MAG: ATP synthase subunit b [uncultured Sulfurovum sp.]|uniref:ATP synthase subunit b n=1 Tax=uncultured Sulfurovum sp. TaxID=269237 RepID=A0A6S6SX69_9BACT|nr:MAG: ATP synthase subunit b [uncultured Sulfurovum sp.]